MLQTLLQYLGEGGSWWWLMVVADGSFGFVREKRKEDLNVDMVEIGVYICAHVYNCYV